MASGLAIEECKHIFSSPCEQPICLHAESSTLTAANTKPDPVPDALPSRPAAAPKGMHSIRLMKSSDGEGRNIAEWDKYVMMTQFHISRDENGEITASISVEPVLITELRPAEQDAAYEALLAKGPTADKVRKYRRLHIRRLDEIRDEIFLSEGEKARCVCVFMQERKKREWEMETETEMVRERVRRAFRDLKEAEKEVGRWRARERAVKRLLVKCEELVS